MVSFFQRYVNGEYEPVWQELRALGPVPRSLQEDVAAVAAATMQRVAGHVTRLVNQLPELGFVPADGWPLRQPPTDADRVDVDALAEEVGGLPAALQACLREVGGVSLLGDWQELDLFYHHDWVRGDTPPRVEYPDPLCLPDAAYLRAEWEDYRNRDERDQDGFSFMFAPDELHKAGVSGLTHDVPLPDRCADPVLLGVAGRENITLVEYLRESIAWGGFPGWAFSAHSAPELLSRLAAQPDF